MGIIEVMNSNVLLASGRASRGLAKPRVPGEGCPERGIRNPAPLPPQEKLLRIRGEEF